VAVCLPRYLGPVETLPAGMWVMSARGPVVSCRGCGSPMLVDARRVGVSGVVTPRVDCETVTCSVNDAWLTLESWLE